MNCCNNEPTMGGTSYVSSDAKDALCNLFQTGDAQVFSIVYRSHYTRLLRTAMRIVRNIDDAEDTLQDAMLKAFRAAHSFRADSSISTWLTRIVINTCLMRLRKERTHRTVSLDLPVDDSISLAESLEDPKTSILDDLILLERRQIAFQAMEGLRPDYRDVVLAYNSVELPMVQVARHNGVSVSTLKSRLRRAKKELQKQCQAPTKLR
jgi:RNA polymerase sigma-70 factor (ECF subfamily)